MRTSSHVLRSLLNVRPVLIVRRTDNMRVQATLLDETNTPRQLSLISPELKTDKTRLGNQGTSTKTPDIAPCSNRYDSAPSSRTGRAVLSSSRNTPREVTVHGDGTESIQVGFLERHPFTTQSFIPMGGSPSPSYVVIVADDRPDGSPDFDSIKAFSVRGDQGVCYAAGVWHAPMATIRKVSVGRLQD